MYWSLCAVNLQLAISSFVKGSLFYFCITTDTGNPHVTVMVHSKVADQSMSAGMVMTCSHS